MMRKRLIGAAALALTFGSVAVAPTTASSAVPKHLRAEYQHHYKELAQRHGKRAPGCNLFRTCKAKPTAARVRRSNATLERMLYVPRPAPVAVAAPASTTATATTVAPTSSSAASTSSSTSLPSCTYEPESGGDYGAYNASSGAYGKYQIIPSTWAAHCSDLGKDPGGQDECAGRVYESQGAGAWVNC